MAGENISGKLGIGRKGGISVGSGVRLGVRVGVVCDVTVGTGVISGIGVIRGVTRRRQPGPGLIGRTGSKYCGRAPCDSVRCTSTGTEGVAGAGEVSAGELAAGSSGLGETVGVAEILLFGGFGVGVGLTNSLFILSPSVSCCSWAARVTATLRAPVNAIVKTKRSFRVTRT